MAVTEQAEQMERRPGERLMLWFLLAVSVFILTTALMTLKLENLSSSGAFPIFMGLVLIGLTLTVLWKNRARYAVFTIGEDCRDLTPFVFPPTVGIFAGIPILYILLLEPLHFWTSSFLFLVGSFLFQGSRMDPLDCHRDRMLVTVYVLFQYTFSVILW